MGRREAREQAFLILFGLNFTKETPEVQMALFSEEEEMPIEDYAKKIILGVCDKELALDQEISAHSHNWSKTRMSKVSLTLLRIALYEMTSVSDVPESVSINEAVELAKNFGAEEDAPFVNGILGSIARSEKNTKEE